jgi:predicted permease
MFRRRRTTDDFSAEIQAHLALETDRRIADGLSPEDARAAAMRAFGNVTTARERFYEESRWTWLEQLAQDLRYGWRGLRQTPAFLATTVLTLAVGLGLMTVAFTVFNTYVLRPYAVQDPSSLHKIAWRSRDAGGQQFRWADYEEIRRREDLFGAAVAESTRFVSSNGRPLGAALVSDNYFEALRPPLVVGRGLASVDEGSDAAVLSDQAWARLFARDVNILGRSIDVNGHPYTIVGVAGPDFVGLGDLPRDVWLLLTTYAAVGQPALTGPDQPRLVEILTRLRRGVTAEQAQAALTPLLARTFTGQEQVRAEVRRQSGPNPLSVQMLVILAPVCAAFALVLMTACANVSSVMLARAVARNREIAVRLSLGASRGRVVRQLLAEGLLIAVLAAVAGLMLAVWALRAATAVLFSTLPASVSAIVRIAPMSFDHRVFLFALAVSALATLMFALVPAHQASRLTLTDALRGQGGHAVRGSRLRGLLVIGQVTVSIVLVVAALTLARNGAAVGAVDLGFDARGVMSVNVREEQHTLIRHLAEALGADPHVAGVAVTNGNPLFIRSRAVAAAPEDRRISAIGTRYTFVSPEYFAVLRIPIARGRGFRADEARSASRVALVSEATAKAFWPGEDPIGRTIRIERPDGRPVDDLPGYTEVTVVGMVKDVVSGLVIDGRDPGHVYLPMEPTNAHATAVLMRWRANGDLNPETLQHVFARAAPDPQAFEAIPLNEMRALQVYPLLAASWVGSLLGAIALALSISGLYGVLSYTLSQRTREIGIRIALGATAAAVVRLVVGQSARLAGVGAGIGLVLAFAAVLALNSAVQLQAIHVIDAVAFASGVAIVAAATALAAYHPARRAARVDPAQTLRADM